MHHDCDPAVMSLYHRAIVCKTFPGYTLESVRDAQASEIMRAMKLLELAHKALAG
jgi:hypothetical protein